MRFLPPPLFLLALFRVCTLTKRLLESSKKRSRPRRSTSIDPEKMLRSSRGGGKGILAFFVCLRLFFGRHGLFFDVIFFLIISKFRHNVPTKATKKRIPYLFSCFAMFYDATNV